MAGCISMASAVVFTIGLQIGHKDVPWCPPVVATPVIMQQISAGMREWCPSEQRHVDAVYGALVREKGREPYGFELWQSYDRSLGMRSLHGQLNPTSYCAIRELAVDGTPIGMPTR